MSISKHIQIKAEAAKVSLTTFESLFKQLNLYLLSFNNFIAFFRIIILSSITLFLLSCSQNMLFSSNLTAPSNPSDPSPKLIEEPHNLDIIPDEIFPEIKAGVCLQNTETSLLNCMNCKSPAAQSLLSEKAEQLRIIMNSSCKISNKSDPQGYSPSKDFIFKLHKCTVKAYSDNDSSKNQKDLAFQLTFDVNLQKKLFGGIWYQPPFSDLFETYFGISVAEARYLFCYNSSYPQEELFPAEYYHNQDSQLSYKPNQEYKKANTYRSQLRKCIQESLTNQIEQPQTPAPCNYEAATGIVNSFMVSKIDLWLSKNLVVGIEIPEKGLCTRIKTLTELNQFNLLVARAAATESACLR